MQHETAPMSLASYRLEKAMSLLRDAQLLFNAGQLASANNRAYYALFHGIRAVLALQQKDFKKHSAAIAAFNQDYIHTGLFDRAYITVINHASIIRNHSDYDDFYICSQEETAELLQDVAKFLVAVSAYLGEQGCRQPDC